MIYLSVKYFKIQNKSNFEVLMLAEDDKNTKYTLYFVLIFLFLSSFCLESSPSSSMKNCLAPKSTQIKPVLFDPALHDFLNFDFNDMVLSLISHLLTSGIITNADLLQFVKTVNKFDFKNFEISIQLLPEYMSLSKTAGLDYADSIKLLIETIDSRSEYTDITESVTMRHLMLLLGTSISEQINISKTLNELFQFIKQAAKHYALEQSLSGLALSLRLGLNLKQAMEIFKLHPDIRGVRANLPIGQFNMILRNLWPSKMNPVLLSEVLKLIIYEENNLAFYDYPPMDIYIYTEVTVNHVSPDRALERYHRIISQIESNSKAPDLLLQDNSNIAEVYYSSNFVNDHFPLLEAGNIPGRAGLPYRLQKTLQSGLNDLQTIANLEINKTEVRLDTFSDISEGSWIVSPEENMWYSLGGIMNIGDKVENQVTPYDISQMGKDLIWIHVHPQAYERFLTPVGYELYLGEFQTKLSAALPSRADFAFMAKLLEHSGGGKNLNFKSLIVNSLGITEIIFPNDEDALKGLATNFQEIIRELLSDPEIEKSVQDVTYFEFVQKSLPYINSKLPKGFEIRLHRPQNFSFLQKVNDYHQSRPESLSA